MRRVLFSVLFMFSPLLSAEIYKTVDENGNVIYTDQKPAPNAEPIDLPDLNVAEPHRPLPPSPEPVDGERAERGLSIVSPAPEENIWGSGGDVDVVLSSATELRDGMSVVVYLDGEAHEAGNALNLTIPGVARGEHRVSAELQDRRGRVLATADEIVFFMKQHSVNAPTGTRGVNNNNNNGNNGNNNGSRNNNR